MPPKNISRRTSLHWGAAALVSTAVSKRSMAGPRPLVSNEVLILGAGMSGLHAARLLQAEGVAVHVIEGSGRVGGRVWTARDLPGRPELGAAQIGASYGRVRANASELGIELVDPPKGAMNETQIPPIAVSIGGALPTGDWAHSSLNKLAPSEKALSPLQLFSHFLLKDDPLKDPSDWQEPRFAPLDQLSLRQYLQQRGASEEALRLTDIANPAYTLDDASALDILRKNHFYFWSGSHGGYSIAKDGTSALTDAMAASLKRPVELNRIVNNIAVETDHVTVGFGDGSQIRARVCLTTIPLSVMKNIRITGPVPSAQRSAWQRQRYSQTVGIFLKLKSAFWEKDGLPATMWTDGPFEIFFHQPSRVDPIGTMYASTNGAAVEKLNRLTPDALRKAVVDELVRLRPAAAGQVEAGYIHNWSTYPFSKGHIAYFAPCDLTRYGSIVGQAVGRLHFAGEHLSRIQAGIEGACESAESAVFNILEKL
jgi:monoamine oxidase